MEDAVISDQRKASDIYHLFYISKFDLDNCFPLSVSHSLASQCFPFVFQMNPLGVNYYIHRMPGFEPHIEFKKELYFPGEEVTGRVWVNTEKELSCRKVDITFAGKAVVAWRTRKNRIMVADSNGEGEKSKEVFVEMKHEVWTPDGDDNKFPSGEYEWNFSFELPKQCASSFEAPYGFIRYSVLVEFDIPNWFDTRRERAITVIGSIDLNAIPGAAEPVELKQEKAMEACGCMPIFSFAPFRRGNVTFTLTTPTLGFVSGQSVHISGTIQNDTSKSINSVMYKFYQRIIYKADLVGPQVFKQETNMFNSRTYKETLANGHENIDVAPGASQAITFSAKIPLVPATIRSTKYLSVEYFVNVNVSFDSWTCSEANADLNVLIGNVPIWVSEAKGVPLHSYQKGPTAECWVSSFEHKGEFQPKYPFYG